MLAVKDIEEEQMKCPECGSTRLIKYGKRFIRSKKREIQQYQCKNCGRITIKPKR